jgi:D-glycerate 3-kinase
MNPRLVERLSELLSAEQLPPDYLDQVQRWIFPLADWLSRQREALGGFMLVGVHGGQGTGKTTLCKVLEILLAESDWRCLTLSIDDFYLPRTRGAPGTHDLGLLTSTLDAMRRDEAVTLPRFNKAEDDREPEGNWPQAGGAVDIVLLEGWCIGCRAQADDELETPINALESDEDPDGRWRRYVNDCLAGSYAILFEKLDALTMLCAPSMKSILAWRTLQEHKLAAQGGSRVMSDSEIQRFVQHYERLTRHALKEMPARADYLLRLDEDHQFSEVNIQ